LGLTWFCFENELVLYYEENDTNFAKLWDSSELAYETLMYTLLHSYVICVYTWLRFPNLFVLFCRITWKTVKWYELVVTLWFWWFCRSWPVKRTCILYCTHMWSRRILSWGIGSCLLGFGSLSQLFLKL